MICEIRDSGLVVPVSETEPKQRESDKNKKERDRQYHVAHYGDWASVMRHMEEVMKADGILVSITRHGSKGSRLREFLLVCPERFDSIMQATEYDDLPDHDKRHGIGGMTYAQKQTALREAKREIRKLR